MRRNPSFRPFASRGRRTVGAILLVFALFSVLSVALSIRATAGAQHQASVIEVAARQRTLAERYVNELLLKHEGKQADPSTPRACSSRARSAARRGRGADGVNGDDDETTSPAATDPAMRAQLEQERRLVNDLTATGDALLARSPGRHAPPDRTRANHGHRPGRATARPRGADLERVAERRPHDRGARGSTTSAT